MARPRPARPGVRVHRKPAVRASRAKCYDWLGRPIRCPPKKKKNGK
jgi:hypothetical protein